ncbi:MAG: S-methyl-5'-thioadenosine phosphorylase [Acidobacteria bacterium]|jgi:5'-methylthioadenosine phosphorylase|nr:S-methyl-5'-thioadenosine phosphorylase [Acidobacteriota bacterium]
MEYAEVGIIGGSGFYDLEGLEGAHSVRLRTPFGAPSEKLMLGKIHGRSVAFLSRHGHGHRLSPSEVNYQANLYAMKMLKVEHLFSITAVGSLKEELKPGELVIPDQYVDQTFKREKTFFSDGIVAHVSFGDPTCPTLGRLAQRLASEAGLPVHRGGTYCNMEGPQFSSRAESLANRQLGHSLIGMTQAVEAKLARELEMCFLPLAFVTDYDCWHQSEESVTVEMVIANLKKGVALIKKLLPPIIAALPPQRDGCACAGALAASIITAPAMIPEKTYKRLELIIGKYIPSRI